MYGKRTVTILGSFFVGPETLGINRPRPKIARKVRVRIGVRITAHVRAKGGPSSRDRSSSVTACSETLCDFGEIGIQFGSSYGVQDRHVPEQIHITG